ncbi:MAG: type III-A CRISPR-associated RAMP protein Csm4 [Clostridia bacterium]|nr:type III-A CRISPR-associated RAMP protein Csm4 [Clostridia bacterium]
MDYCLFKLRFDGAVHFGQSDSALSLYTSADHFYADTLFSALCHTAGTLYGEAGIERLCAQAQAGELLLSDSMPWRERNGNDIYYLPKPCATSSHKQDIPAHLRKAIKKLAWIPVQDMGAFEQSLQGEQLYMPDEEAFGVMENRTLAAVSDGEDTRPYQVGVYRFFPSCGLYVIAGCASKAQQEELAQLIAALGLGGIGGKVSSGFGTFTLDRVIDLNHPVDAQTGWLRDALTQPDPRHHLLLTTSLPTDEELETVLEDAQYQLVRRGGYVQSDTFSHTPQRKCTQYFLAAGAMLEHSFEGALYDAVPSGRHPVYRYSKPITLGVSF